MLWLETCLLEGSNTVVAETVVIIGMGNKFT
jgi:hypothetical protein